MMVNKDSLGIGLLVGQKKQFEDATLSSWKLTQTKKIIRSCSPTIVLLDCI